MRARYMNGMNITHAHTLEGKDVPRPVVGAFTTVPTIVMRLPSLSSSSSSVVGSASLSRLLRFLFLDPEAPLDFPADGDDWALLVLLGFVGELILLDTEAFAGDFCGDP